MCAILASERRRSVMSWCVVTMPIGHWLDRDGYETPIGKLGDVLPRLSVVAPRAHGLYHFVERFGGVLVSGNPPLHQLAQRGAGPEVCRLETVDLRIPPIGDNLWKLGVEHRQALRHVVQGRVQVLAQPLAFGNILMRTHQAAVRHLAPNEADEAAVRQRNDIGRLLVSTIRTPFGICRRTTLMMRPSASS